MKLKSMLLWLGVGCIGLTLTTDFVHAQLTRKARERVQARIRRDPPPPGLDGRCKPTCIKTICGSFLPTEHLWEAVDWCRSACLNSPSARRLVASRDYPANVCKGKLPPYDPIKSKWEQELRRFKDPRTRQSRADEMRRNVFSGDLSMARRAGLGVQRFVRKGVKGFQCKFCRDQRQVCPPNPKAKRNQAFCVKYCHTERWLRSISDNPSYNPQLRSQEAYRDNLEENMKIYIQGLCSGKAQIQSSMTKAGQNIASRFRDDASPVYTGVGTLEARPTQRRPVQRFRYPTPSVQQTPSAYPNDQDPDSAFMQDFDSDRGFNEGESFEEDFTDLPGQSGAYVPEAY